MPSASETDEPKPQNAKSEDKGADAYQGPEEEPVGGTFVTSTDYVLLVLVAALLILELLHLVYAIRSGLYDTSLERVGHVSVLLELGGLVGLFLRSPEPGKEGRVMWDGPTIIFTLGLLGTLPHLAKWVFIRLLKLSWSSAIFRHAWTTHLALAVHLLHVSSESTPSFRPFSTSLAALLAFWRLSVYPDNEGPCLLYILFVSGALALVSAGVKRPETLPGWLRVERIGAGAGVALGFIVGGWIVRFFVSLIWRAFASKSWTSLALLVMHWVYVAWLTPSTSVVVLPLATAIEIVPFLFFGNKLFQATLVLFSAGLGVVSVVVNKLEEAEAEQAGKGTNGGDGPPRPRFETRPRASTGSRQGTSSRRRRAR